MHETRETAKIFYISVDGQRGSEELQLKSNCLQKVNEPLTYVNKSKLNPSANRFFPAWWMYPEPWSCLYP